MNRYEIYVLICGMALATYLPRALPAFFMDKLRFGRKFQRFLTLLPYTAMSALIFPGVFSVDAAHPLFGIISGLLAVLLAVRKCPLIVCVLGAVGTNAVLYLLI